MNIIIPMAGAGQRFADEGYKTSKPAIPTIDRRTGKEYPMVVCATMDLPFVKDDGSNVTYIDRTFHKENGVEDVIKEHYSKASFITLDKLTDGQACTCLEAKDKIDNDESLLIAGCDNGMVIDLKKYEKLTTECDVLAFTYRHNPSVLTKPDAYGWMIVDDESTGKITGISIKKAISATPMDDHAIVATFWFKHGCDFVRAAEKMIAENDRVNNEFYVDQVVKHCIELGMDTRVFEIERYIGWGTPKDYEEYQETIRYWREFTDSEGFLPGKR
jgi:bifunctional N-acetylglucosamine-1-phosphate-uridyltransferase/glucosamine-1-phosphate-acetyltransferase GlmU-like protein